MRGGPNFLNDKDPVKYPCVYIPACIKAVLADARFSFDKLASEFFDCANRTRLPKPRVQSSLRQVVPFEERRRYVAL